MAAIVIAAGVNIVLTRQFEAGEGELLIVSGKKQHIFSAKELSDLSWQMINVLEKRKNGAQNELRLKAIPLYEVLAEKRIFLTKETVRVTASDNFAVDFSAQEVLNGGVWLCSGEDGIRIAVPDDEFSTRWVRQVRRIELMEP